MGPGIEEEYADALEAISGIRKALGPRRLTNDTPDGRLLLNVQWLEQEIRAQRLPIPVDRSYVNTVFYLVGSGDLASVPGLKEPLGKLSLVLDGDGLMKPRHLPVLIALIVDLTRDADDCRARLTPAEERWVEELKDMADDLRRGGGLAEGSPPPGLLLHARKPRSRGLRR